MNSQTLKKFMSSTAWSFISAVATKFSVVITGILVARILGTQTFGEYGLIQSAIVMLATVAAQATTTATAKHIGQNKGQDPQKTGRGIALTMLFALTFCTLIAATALTFPSWFCTILLGGQNLQSVLLMVLALISLTILGGWTQGCLTGWEQYKTIAKINGSIALVSIPATYLLTLNFRLQGALAGLVLAQVLILLCSALASWKLLKAQHTRLTLREALTEKHAILSVGVPVLLTGLMVAPINWFGNKLLSETANGFTALGMYSAAMQWNAIFSHVSVVLGAVLIPMLAANLGKNNRRMEALNFLSGWLVVLVIIQPVILFPELLARLYGENFAGRDFEVTLVLVISGSLLSAFKAGISRKMVVMNLAWYSVFSNLIWGLMFIAGAYWLRDEGAIGIAKAYVGSQFIHFLVSLPYFIYKRILPRELVISPSLISLWLLPLLSYLTSMHINNDLYRIGICAMIYTYILGMVLVLSKKFSEPLEIGSTT